MNNNLKNLILEIESFFNTINIKNLELYYNSDLEIFYMLLKIKDNQIMLNPYSNIAYKNVREEYNMDSLIDTSIKIKDSNNIYLSLKISKKYIEKELTNKNENLHDIDEHLKKLLEKIYIINEKKILNLIKIMHLIRRIDINFSDHLSLGNRKITKSLIEEYTLITDDNILKEIYNIINENNKKNENIKPITKNRK